MDPKTEIGLSRGVCPDTPFMLSVDGHQHCSKLSYHERNEGRVISSELSVISLAAVCRHDSERAEIRHALPAKHDADFTCVGIRGWTVGECQGSQSHVPLAAGLRESTRHASDKSAYLKIRKNVPISFP